MIQKSVFLFSEVDRDDEELIGMRGIKLSEMTRAGLPIPEGFIITPGAYFSFLGENNLITRINQQLSTTNFDRPESIFQISSHIRRYIIDAKMPNQFSKMVSNHYKTLISGFTDSLAHIFASSALPGHSPASYIIKREDELSANIKKLWAAFYEPKMLLRRHRLKLDQISESTAVVVQKLIAPLKTGKITTSKLDRSSLEIKSDSDTLTDEERAKLEDLGLKIKRHFYFPQEVHWSILNGKAYVLKIQNSVIDTVHKTSSSKILQRKLLLKGKVISHGIATGPVRVVRDKHDLGEILRGDIAVVEYLSPDYFPAIQKASGLVIIKNIDNHNLRIALQNLGIPVISTAENPINAFRAGAIVTVHGNNGEVYGGEYTR